MTTCPVLSSGTKLVLAVAGAIKLVEAETLALGTLCELPVRGQQCLKSLAVFCYLSLALLLSKRTHHCKICMTAAWMDLQVRVYLSCFCFETPPGCVRPLQMHCLSITVAKFYQSARPAARLLRSDDPGWNPISQSTTIKCCPGSLLFERLSFDPASLERLRDLDGFDFDP